MEKGVVYITQFGIDQARAFRESWSGSPITSLKRLERMKSFFAWVLAQRWIETNPARGLKAPKTDDAPADPISDEDLADLVGAIERMPTREGEKNMSHDRLLAMILLLRHTGLRIGDIVRFSTDRLKGHSVMLRMAKTKNPVWLPLPEFLVATLKALPLYEEKYYFAAGSAKLGTATGNARRSLRKLSKLARIRTVNPHRFRDTLAIKLLQQGVPVEDVKEILGHEDVNITLRHYGNWVKERQDRLTGTSCFSLSFKQYLRSCLALRSPKFERTERGSNNASEAQFHTVQSGARKHQQMKLKCAFPSARGA